MYSKWFRDIILYHCLKEYESGKITVDRHVKVHGVEHDVLVSCEGERAKKTIAIELKDSDLEAVINQAIKRAGTATYAYAVVNLPIASVFRILKAYPEKYLNEIFSSGIGLASGYDNIVIFYSYSPGKRQYSTEHLSLLKWLPLSSKAMSESD